MPPVDVPAMTSKSSWMRWPVSFSSSSARLAVPTLRAAMRRACDWIWTTADRSVCARGCFFGAGGNGLFSAADVAEAVRAKQRRLVLGREPERRHHAVLLERGDAQPLDHARPPEGGAV